MSTLGEAAPKIVAAVIILGIGLLVGRVIGFVVKTIAEKMNLDRAEGKQSSETMNKAKIKTKDVIEDVKRDI